MEIDGLSTEVKSHFLKRFNHIVISRITLCWVMMGVLIVLSNKNTQFFNYGPNKNLKIIGIIVDTPSKYFFLILFTFFNTCLRTCFHNIVSPWIILNVQDETKPWHKESYEMSITSVLYIWFDWFVNISILLSQYDLALIDIFAEITMCIVVTRRYKLLKTM